MSKTENGQDNATNGVGHNSRQLTEDERRVLTYHHKRKLDEIELELTAIKAKKRAAEDLAKSELGKGAIADIKDLRALEAPKGNEALQASIERQLRLARWANAPVGHQFALMDDMRPDEDRAYELGKTAGLSGEPKKPPYDASVPQYRRWCDGWDAGYSVLLSDFRDKLKPVERDENIDQMDLSERTDLGDDLTIPNELRRTA